MRRSAPKPGWRAGRRRAGRPAVAETWSARSRCSVCVGSPEVGVGAHGAGPRRPTPSPPTPTGAGGRGRPPADQLPNTGPAMITDGMARISPNSRSGPGRRPGRRWPRAGRGAAARSRAAPTGRPARGCRSRSTGCAGAPRDEQHDRDEQDDADLEEQRDADQRGHPAHRPGQRPGRPDPTKGDHPVRAAGGGSRPPIIAPSAISRPTLPTVARRRW